MTDDEWPNYPCPNHITDEDGQNIYCVQGEKGHWGTCIGDRTEAEYKELCRQVRQSRARIRALHT
jgi:hypothetical protein